MVHTPMCMLRSQRIFSAVRFTCLLIVAAVLIPAPRVAGKDTRHSPLPAQPMHTFMVTSADDSGAGTLRQAILDANGSPGLDEIALPIAGETTIRPSSPLPEITDPVLVDGTTQPGFAGHPIVEIDGSSAGTDA